MKNQHIHQKTAEDIHLNWNLVIQVPYFVDIFSYSDIIKINIFCDEINF